MNEIKQSTPSPEEGVARVTFWGTIALSAIALLVYAYFSMFLLRQPKTPVIYIALTVFLSSFVSAIVSIVLTIRHRQPLGVKLAFYTLFIMGITIISVLQGRAQTASLSILVISIVEIVWLLPRGSRSWYYGITAAAMLVMWGVEWINPPWRIAIAAATVGPAAVIVFCILLAIIGLTQSWKYISNSLRYKMLAAFLGVTLIVLVSLGVYFNIRLRNVLNQNTQQNLSQLADHTAHEVDTFIGNQLKSIDIESRNPLFVQLLTLDVAHRLGSDEVSNAQGVLRVTANQDKKFINSYAVLDNKGIVILDTANGLGKDDSQAAFFKDAVAKDQPTVTGPLFDQKTGKASLYFSAPIKSPTGATTLGVLVMEYNANVIESLVEGMIPPGNPNSILFRVVDKTNFVRIAHTANLQLLYKPYKNIPANEIVALQKQSLLPPGSAQDILAAEDTTVTGLENVAQAPFFVTASKTLGTNTLNTAAPMQTVPWLAFVRQSDITVTAPLANQTRTIMIISLVLLGLVTLASLAFSQILSSPIFNLTTVAQKIAVGDLSVRAEARSQDEIGFLASTFNKMTDQLNDLIGSLEQRVAARTRNLELAAEVGRAVSQVRELNVMLKDACELILKEFDLYYVQVYLVNPSQTVLKLEAGTGAVGAELIARRHSLPFDTNSINGRAAVDKHTVVIADTDQSATFRKNALLPETRGEMAVPLIVADRVVGVLDMQSSQPGVLAEEALPAFEALAGQLAVAIQNANLLAETEEAHAEAEKQARRLVREGWIEHLDAIHKPEQIGFAFTNNQIVSLDDKNESQVPDHDTALSAPISVTGEALGSLVVELDNEAQGEQTNELVNIVARQVAQQIENLRLLESAERYRYESELAARRQTAEGWQQYMASKSTENLTYLYDTQQVLPQVNDRAEEAFQFALPLKARDEMIGKLGVQGLSNDDHEAVELVNAVAERLSAHIENLRLFEETRLGQVELDKRARQLAAVAEITTVSSRESNSQKMLEAVVHLTQQKFSLYHCHIFLFNEQTNILKIAACGWQEGDLHEGTHGTAAISLDQEQSLVARAARTQKAVIVNDVHNEPGWLPNPMLPDTAAELAVPLVVGGRLLGVLDVQSDRLNAFSNEDASIQTTLASQVATALQNVYSFNQAQSALAQSEKLFDASRRLTQAADLQDLVKSAVAALDIHEIDRVILGGLDYSSAGDLEGMTIIANWSEQSDLQATPIGTHYTKEALNAVSLFKSTQPLFFDDMLNDKRVDEMTLAIAKRLNYRSVAALPLYIGSRQDALLLFEGEQPHNFTAEEIRLFSALAPQLATVLENRRQFEKAQRQAEREAMLNAIGQKIQGATTVEAVLQIAARELGRALSAPMTVAQLGLGSKTAGNNGN